MPFPILVQLAGGAYIIHGLVALFSCVRILFLLLSSVFALSELYFGRRVMCLGFLFGRILELLWCHLYEIDGRKSLFVQGESVMNHVTIECYAI